MTDLQTVETLPGFEDAIRSAQRAAAVRRWRERNPDYAKQYRQANREARAAYNREYQRRNPEKMIAKQKRYAKRHPDKVRANWRAQGKRKYYQDLEQTRLLGRIRAHERRALERDSDTADYVQVLLRDPCSYCGGPAREIDHIVPTAAAGPNSQTNLTAACRSCNARKSNRSVLTFLAERLDQ